MGESISEAVQATNQARTDIEPFLEGIAQKLAQCDHTTRVADLRIHLAIIETYAACARHTIDGTLEAKK